VKFSTNAKSKSILNILLAHIPSTLAIFLCQISKKGRNCFSLSGQVLESCHNLLQYPSWDACRRKEKKLPCVHRSELIMLCKIKYSTSYLIQTLNGLTTLSHVDG
jgi:hypothetical protein